MNFFFFLVNNIDCRTKRHSYLAVFYLPGIIFSPLPVRVNRDPIRARVDRSCLVKARSPCRRCFSPFHEVVSRQLETRTALDEQPGEKRRLSSPRKVCKKTRKELFYRIAAHSTTRYLTSCFIEIFRKKDFYLPFSISLSIFIYEFESTFLNIPQIYSTVKKLFFRGF